MENKKTILIVDDEENIRSSLKDLFELEDEHHILTASSGSEAVKILQGNSVDFILSDIRMPDGDGLALTKVIKDQYNNVPPILLMSGFNDISAEDAKKNGAIDIVKKPFDFDELFELIKKQID